MFFGSRSRHFEYARQNREKSTQAEEKLWEEIKRKKFKNLKFRRQHPVGIFILDFYCHALKLAIEVDGAYHLDETQKEYDLNRTKMLGEAGIMEMRFTNDEIMSSLDEVLKKVEAMVGS